MSSPCCLCSTPNCFVFYAVSVVLKEIRRLVRPRNSQNITTRGHAVAQAVSNRGVSPDSIPRHAVYVTGKLTLGRLSRVLRFPLPILIPPAVPH
jgi:hypothetical protein